MQFICNYLPGLSAPSNETRAHVSPPADGNTNAFPRRSAMNIALNGWCLDGGGDAEKWEGPSIVFPMTINHTQQAAHGRRRRWLKLALLSGCHAASRARSQLGTPGKSDPLFPLPSAGQFSLLSSSQPNFPSERSSIKRRGSLIFTPRLLICINTLSSKITEASEPPPPPSLR